jgi:hypothetical protein
MTRELLRCVALAVLVAACDSPIDTDPTASIDADAALTTARGIELAMNGAYRQLQSGSLYGRQEQAFNDMYADNLNFTGTFTGDREVSLRAITPSNGEVGGMWSAAYVGVNRANLILDALPTVSDLSDAQKNQYRGEALFLRGLFYSLLVKYYGGVPLVDKPHKGFDESMFAARATQPETYAFIIKDLEEAVTLLAAPRSHGRATQGAANALLARVYLEDGKYTQARDKATLVINNTLYRLTTTFREIFTLKNNTESIFELQFTVLNSNSLAFWFFPTPLGRLGFAPSATLYDAFELGDTRRAASIKDTLNTRIGFKYYRIAQGDDNVPVLRLAEQHLIRAEANARLNAPAATVHADINIVRKRAGLGDLDLAVTTQQALLDAVLQERRVELAFEGHRFADLRRHGKAQTVLSIAASKLLWPIPLYETDVNKNLVQNPGY